MPVPGASPCLLCATTLCLSARLASTVKVEQRDNFCYNLSRALKFPIRNSIVQGRNSRMRRFIYIVTPLILLLLCIGSINLLPHRGATTAESIAIQSTETAVAPGRDSEIVPAITLAATPLPTLTATASPPLLPTIPPEASIILLGPPSDSTFVAGNALSVYWTWPLPMVEGQQFALYWRADGAEQLLGTVTEPNLGRQYQFAIPATEPATATWFVRLEQIEPFRVLATSEARSIQIIGRR